MVGIDDIDIKTISCYWFQCQNFKPWLIPLQKVLENCLTCF